VYSREIEGETRSFGVSGRLWHGVLVMYDRETHTYWTQLDGRAIRGEELGERLEHVPSVFTSFGSWLDAHPDTLVLDKTDDDKRQAASRYADYFADPDRLVTPHLSDGLGELPPKVVVFGVRHAGGALAVAEGVLERDLVVNLTVGGEPVALLRNTITGEVIGVERVLDGKPVDLAPLEGYETTERVQVVGSDRKVQAAELASVRVDRAFWYAWARTVDDAELIRE